VRAPSPALVMSDAQREILESLAKSQTAAHREVTRAKALLLAADGLASTAVAYALLQLADPGLELLDELTECATVGLKGGVARYAG